MPIPTGTAKPFEKVAEDILHNTDRATFGGAAVIVPPEGGGDPIELLVLSSTGDPAEFWILLKTRVDAQIQAVDQATRTKAAYPRR